MENRGRATLPGMMWYVVHFEIPEIDPVCGSSVRDEKIAIVGPENNPSEILERAERIKKAKERIRGGMVLTSVFDQYGSVVYCI